MSAALELPVLESQLAITAAWILVREGAIDGLRARIAIEERGMELDRAAGRDYAMRLAQLEQLGRALKQATAWKPIAEIPRRA